MKNSSAVLLSLAIAFVAFALSPLCASCLGLFHSAEGLVSFYAIAGIVLIGIGDYSSKHLIHGRS